jgi:mRNA interferase MazF
MKKGDIVVVSFPYTDLISFKARPAVVVKQIRDNYNDVIVSLISSVVPELLFPYQILLQANKINNLKRTSVIKVARLATVEQDKIVAVIGKLSEEELKRFETLFKSLVD